TKNHQLIKTKARQRTSQPDIEKQKEDHLAEKIKNAKPWNHMHERTIPAAEKEGGRQHRNREHVDVLSQKEQREFHRAVLGVKSGDQLSLRLRQVKRHSIGFGDGRDQINHKAQRLHPDYIPTTDAQVARLLFDNAVEIERARLQD